MYFLIGNPLTHSFSADYFNTKFRREGISDYYRLIPLEEIDELPGLLDSLEDAGEHPVGFNVTIPYKESILPYLDHISSEAKEIGAVNVVAIRHTDSPEGKRRILTGHNTDCIGFHRSITPLLKPSMRNALVLGTGGAAKSVVHTLLASGLDVKRVSRRPGCGDLTYGDLSENLIAGYDVIVNTTPLGTYPDTDGCPDIPYEGLHAGQICHDLVYNPEVTEFMRRASRQGATVKSGLEMLHGQAEAAWEIWCATVNDIHSHR